MLKDTGDKDSNAGGTDLKLAMMTRAAMMAALTAVAAQIVIPFFPVPFTLQVFAVVLAGFLLGPRYGALAMAIYLLIGMVGVPVFSEFRGGLGHLLGPTGGYLVSYPLAAAIAGLAAPAAANAVRWRALMTSVLAGAVALVVIYALGMTWLMIVAQLPLLVALAQGVLPFVAFDLIKVGLAAVVAVAAAPAIVPSRT
ncbi:MAG: biotin transporter BioY [Rubrobacteraceae bacterium]